MFVFLVTEEFPLSETQSQIANGAGLVFVRTEGFFAFDAISKQFHTNTWKSKHLNSLNTFPGNLDNWLVASLLPISLFYWCFHCFHFLSALSVITGSLENRHFCQLIWGKFIKCQTPWNLYSRTSKGTQKIKSPGPGFYLPVMPWGSGQGWHFCRSSNQCDESGWIMVFAEGTKVIVTPPGK